MYLIKDYPGTFGRVRSSPAESNHSSIVVRLGVDVFSPLDQISKMISHHEAISSERNQGISKYHLRSLSKQLTMKESILKEGITKLGKWGYRILESAFYVAQKTMEQQVCQDTGRHQFFNKQMTTLLFVLPENPRSCECQWYKKYNGYQCSLLILAQDRTFDLKMWNPPLHQRNALGISIDVCVTTNTDPTADECMDECVDGEASSFPYSASCLQDSDNEDEDNFGDITGGNLDDGEDTFDDAVMDGNQSTRPDPSQAPQRNKPTTFNYRTSIDVCNNLAHNLDKLKDPCKKEWIIGMVMELNDI